MVVMPLLRGVCEAATPDTATGDYGSSIGLRVIPPLARMWT